MTISTKYDIGDMVWFMHDNRCVFHGKRMIYSRGVKWLINESSEYCLWDGKTKHVDTMGFRGTFRKIEKAFNEIIEKRRKRKEKK